MIIIRLSYFTILLTSSLRPLGLFGILVVILFIFFHYYHSDEQLIITRHSEKYPCFYLNETKQKFYVNKQVGTFQCKKDLHFNIVLISAKHLYMFKNVSRTKLIMEIVVSTIQVELSRTSQIWEWFVYISKRFGRNLSLVVAKVQHRKMFPNLPLTHTLV